MCPRRSASIRLQPSSGSVVIPVSEGMHALGLRERCLGEKGISASLGATCKMHEDMLYERIVRHAREPSGAVVEPHHVDGKVAVEAKCQSMP